MQGLSIRLEVLTLRESRFLNLRTYAFLLYENWSQLRGWEHLEDTGRVELLCREWASEAWDMWELRETWLAGMGRGLFQASRMTRVLTID